METKLDGDQKRLNDLKQKIEKEEKSLGATGMKTLHGLLKSNYIKK